VHFAGHSHYDPATPARSGWRLAQGMLTAGDLAKVHPPPLLVFSNSCEAGTRPARESGDGYEGHAFGIGSAFLLSGASNYVGTFWVVHDEESVLFATTCYRALAGGASSKEALRQLAMVIAQRGWQSLTLPVTRSTATRLSPSGWRAPGARVPAPAPSRGTASPSRCQQPARG
jgi:CHAT domain-containing protein